MPRFSYGFWARPGEIERPYLPIKIINPHTGKEFNWMSQIDTGADSCLISKTICEILNHNLKGDGVKSNITFGITGEDTLVWKHTYILQLLHPDSIDKVVWSSKEILIDCIDGDSFPVLLGSDNFLCNFIITLDYQKKLLIVEF
jgi:hypothetical protein